MKQTPENTVKKLLYPLAFLSALLLIHLFAARCCSPFSPVPPTKPFSIPTACLAGYAPCFAGFYCFIWYWQAAVNYVLL